MDPILLCRMRIFIFVYFIISNILNCLTRPESGNLLAQLKVRKFERNTNAEFEFVTLDTKVEIPYKEMPEQSTFFWDMDSPDLLFGDGCDVQLTIDLIDFQQVPLETSVVICLYKMNITSVDRVMVPNQKMEILGNQFDPILYYRKLFPVSGFVMGEFNSVVTGFLINSNFFGTIRLFDSLPHHHILFYVEPFRNLALYNSDLENLKREPGFNAVLFEYIRHEADIGGKVTEEKDQDLEQKTNDNMNSAGADVEKQVKVRKGFTTSNMFDARKDDSTICALCIWIQPNFAEKFGLRGGVRYGVGEIINMFTFVQYIFQGIDFNGDNFADEISLVIKDIFVSDEINVDKKPDAKEATPSGSTTTATTTATTTTTTTTTTTPSPGDDSKRNAPKVNSKASNSDYEESELEEEFSREVKQLNAEEAYENLRTQLVKHYTGKKCCAIIAYIYHNLVPKLAFSTLGGLCSEHHNVGLISGFIHGHKIGKFDLYRYTMHTLGHLFGAKADDISNPVCKAEVMETPRIFNPSLMDAYHKIDMGIRPNAMKYSKCAKIDITAFLTTNNAHCLRTSSKLEAKCGNGVVEPGEDCDCGLPWQCHTDEQEKPSCCGESDTFVGCRKIGAMRYRNDAHCHRPFIW